MTTEEPRHALADPELGTMLARLREKAPGPDVDIIDEPPSEAELRWARCIPARFIDAEISQLDVDSCAVICEWLSALTRDEPLRNLVLLGPVGTGKTHAAVAALRLASEAGCSIAFSPVVELLDALRPGHDDSNDRLRTLTEVRVLLLDDLGAEKSTEWTHERLYALVNRRWLERRATIVTSNLTPEQLEESVDKRLYSRLVDDALALRLTGADRRRA